MNKRPQTLRNRADELACVTDLKEDPNKDPRKKIYRTAQWRRFRARLYREQRAKDIETAKLMFEQNRDILLEEYYNWMGSNAPLCREYLKESRLIPANVLDHIKPIESGGAIWDRANLQWLSHEKHQKKRGRERHQQ